MPQATIVTRLTAAEIEVAGRKRNFAFQPPDVALQGLRNHDRLLEDLLLHEVAIIALIDRSGRSAGLDDIALDRLVVAVEDLDALAADHRPIAFVEIGDALGPGGDRKRVGPEVILALAVAHRQRRTHARADDEIGVVAEEEGNGEGPLQARQHALRPRPAAMRRASTSRATKWATTSVSVSLSNLRPSAISSSRSGLKFSMMPLWTMATGPTMCGWALPTVGAP